MKSAANRDTFISCKVLLERLAVQCGDAGRDLRRTLSDAEQPYRAGLELIADTQNALANDIQKFADLGPDNLLETHLQYSPMRTAGSAPAQTVGEAVKRLERVNADLDAALRDLLEKAPQASVSAAVEALRREVNTVKRKISLIRTSLRDA